MIGSPENKKRQTVWIRRPTTFFPSEHHPAVFIALLPGNKSFERLKFLARKPVTILPLNT